MANVLNLIIFIRIRKWEYWVLCSVSLSFGAQVELYQYCHQELYRVPKRNCFCKNKHCQRHSVLKVLSLFTLICALSQSTSFKSWSNFSLVNPIKNIRSGFTCGRKHITPHATAIIDLDKNKLSGDTLCI